MSMRPLTLPWKTQIREEGELWWATINKKRDPKVPFFIDSWWSYAGSNRGPLDCQSSKGMFHASHFVST